MTNLEELMYFHSFLFLHFYFFLLFRSIDWGNVISSIFKSKNTASVSASVDIFKLYISIFLLLQQNTLGEILPLHINALPNSKTYFLFTTSHMVPLFSHNRLSKHYYHLNFWSVHTHRSIGPETLELELVWTASERGRHIHHHFSAILIYTFP